jgi:hypothetical protein
MAEVEVGARGKLEEIRVAVETRRPAIRRLAEFLKVAEKAGRLSREDRLRIVEQALLLLEMNYVHLPLKRAMHAIDPVQRLKLLRLRISGMKESQLPSELQFHRQMLAIFASARDLHTMYLLPAPYRDHVAYLPFLIEQYYEDDRRGRRVEKFMVSRMVGEAAEPAPKPAPGAPRFEPGVEVLFWNGVPIRRAIEINGETQAGSNLEARFARGLDSLTIRPLDTSLPPDEHWVEITYRANTGEVATRRQDWLVYPAGEIASPFFAARNSSKKRAAIDIKKTRINEVKRSLYAPTEIRLRQSMQSILSAETRRVDRRDYGYLRLFSFDVGDPEKFIEDFVRLITSEAFPQEGLIIDVRGNGGGKIRAGERLLQLFTPNRIKPELFEFINTPLNLEICRLAPKSWNLARWTDSIAEAVVTGATYSSGFPLNSEDSCNDLGQVYYGPVVLITDALSYSATDIFAAGFQDNEVGEILGTSENTGAGGANVWWYDDLMRAVGAGLKSPFKPLPKGADLLLAVRRSIRVGRHSGRPLEELGITPDQRHFMTKRDILGSNEDLIRRAAGILRQKPVFSLSVIPFTGKGRRGVTLSAASKVPSRRHSEKISRLDIFIDGRLRKSIDARAGAVGPRRVAIEKGRRGQIQLVVEARDGTNKLVARCRKLI